MQKRQAVRNCLLVALASGVVHAAVIRGTVVENQTGHPLARASVTLEPVAGSAGPRLSIRTSSYGAFEFPSLPAGTYLIAASRRAFAAVQYGQKRWNSSGTPIAVAESDSVVLNIRLPRFGSITGTVVDENEVGMPEYEVAAYRNTRPPQFVAKAVSDDRGMFRIYGLPPGAYLVRSLAKQYEDGGYIPTFARETQNVDQAYVTDVELDQQVDQVNVRPFPGLLYTLAVQAVPTDPPNQPVTMTLVSSMGRQTVQTAIHSFPALPPGEYEVFAQAPSGAAPAVQGAYRRFILDRNMDLSIGLRREPALQFQFEGAPLQAADSIQVIGRRKDLAGASEPQTLKLVNNRVLLAPGPWQFALAPLPGYYAAGFSAAGAPRPADLRADGWNDITVGYVGTVRFTLSSNACAVHGTVTDSQSPVIGAPVFVEPLDLDPERRVTDTYMTLTDIHGQYRFSSLAPGKYRVLASFEYLMPDSNTMTKAGAKPIKLDEGHDLQQDLDLYVIR
ncbi:MAG TPA: carboxypeptidase-like regulatory domain-containing protein [Bryobacteraceae bacterium]|nr:carboxypeptidase-like regulatory domain-containing protein [Bryobacteraceae bacterium]